jgi:uncharacterized C2H2 Zn-finger protein
MLDREKYFNKLKSLNQYKTLSEEELYKVVDKKILEEELINSFVGLNEIEKIKAIQLYDKYVTENSFENLAEKSSLTNLVYLEALNDRIKLFIEKEEKERNGAIPIQMVEQLISNNEQIMKLKDQLGMLKNKDNDSFLIAWEELKRKALAYYNTHAGETFVKCPECQKLFRLLMKIDGLEVVKASFFKGTSLYNTKLLKLYEDKRLTVEEVAEILEVHSKYIDFIFQNIYLKEKEKEL